MFFSRVLFFLFARNERRICLRPEARVRCFAAPLSLSLSAYEKEHGVLSAYAWRKEQERRIQRGNGRIKRKEAVLSAFVVNVVVRRRCRSSSSPPQKSPRFLTLSFFLSLTFRSDPNPNPQMGSCHLRGPAQEATGRLFVREGEFFCLFLMMIGRFQSRTSSISRRCRPRPVPRATFSSSHAPSGSPSSNIYITHHHTKTPKLAKKNRPTAPSPTSSSSPR